MAAPPLIAGVEVEVYLCFGKVIGMRWTSGYEFVRYENDAQTSCMVKRTRGTFAGVEVRYRAKTVRWSRLVQHAPA